MTAPVNRPAPATQRGRAKAARRQELLTAAAHLMAERGFSAVRLEDIGAAVGISGPAMYRHFAGKDDVLAEILVDISERLHDGGVAVVDAAPDARTALDGLIDFHIRFVLTEPDLIRVQDRDLSSLQPVANKTVRSLQRRYVELWTDTLLVVTGVQPVSEARLRVQAVFGLLNSSPRLPDVPRQRAGQLLANMALAALAVGNRVPEPE
ncbi:TetR/AcrR family transcriptional regulator [Williamsia sterculiae]|uniref:Transcriptional regulator, TetR family n=1 Tax=Williamsia sterculiae TaxID=1344003 RepID=A0A1N7DI81_9NOCA|nr:TetR/AcrR family transcriptional regulator [Williamsia sterculiae]SIR75532.1 transcriptional regulator, TetR family [Williamsia sterculiae]